MQTTRDLVIAIAILFGGGCVVGGPDVVEDGIPEEDIAASAELIALAPEDITTIGDGAVADAPLVIEATGNLLIDPSFETWGGWVRSYATGSSVSRSTEADLLGKYGMRIKSASGVKPKAAAYQFVDAVPGRTYTVSAYTRWRPGGQGDQQRMEVWFYECRDDGDYLQRKYAKGTGNLTAWHKLKIRVTAPPKACLIAVALGDYATDLYGSTHDWDLVSVVAE